MDPSGVIYSVRSGCNIDESDECGVDIVRSSLMKMLEQERHYAVDRDYLKSGNSDLDLECRRLMAQWCVNVVERCGYRRETIAYTLSYVDRYLATLESEFKMERSKFQLAVMTCLYTAVKVLNQNTATNDSDKEKGETMVLTPQTVSQWTLGAYTPQDVQATELEILFALGWRCHPPTSRSFVHHLVHLTELSSKQKERVLEEALVRVDQVVLDYELAISTKPSWIAYCAMVNAIVHIKISDTWQDDTVVDDIPPQKKSMLRKNLGAAFEIICQQGGFRNRDDNSDENQEGSASEKPEKTSVSPTDVLSISNDEYGLSSACAMNLFEGL